MTPAEQVREKYPVLGPWLNERQCRLWAAMEARSLGRGGGTLVAQATGGSRKRIWVGLRELAHHERTTGAGSPHPNPGFRSGPPAQSGVIRRPNMR